MERFRQAMELTGTEFRNRVVFIVKSWLPARTLVEEAVDKRFQNHSSGQILVFQKSCPWKEHLTDIETERGLKEPLPLFTLFPDSMGSPPTWRIQTIPLSPGNFESRRMLPVAWRGRRDAELSEASNIPGGVFVHNTGFIGGNKTKEGALQMAIAAVETKPET
eukprot:Lithocolla_globosa_v1_NODE_2189_length_2118_cov_96.889481.p2 type:complete len:163 gc:universal NODE_2189_length_2118_cov_96.889481:754-266(-)